MFSAPFSIITFPFLFAVMFGDAGHAVILLLFGLWMCLWEKKLVKMAEDSEVRYNLMIALHQAVK